MGLLIRVEVRECAEPGRGRGVFALEAVPAGTLVWDPSLVSSWSSEEAVARLRAMPPEEAHVFLRHAFVAPSDPDRLQINPDDEVRPVCV